MSRLIRAWNANFKQPPVVITDFGANVGDFSFELGQAFPEAEVYAYEPVPSTFQKLTTRVADLPNVKCINKGVWDREGVLQIGIPQSREASNVGLFSLLHPSGQLSQDIELLDIRSLTERPELVKIDVEGLEYDLLYTSPEYYSNTKLIFYEHLPAGHANYHDSLEKIPALLESWGFKAYDKIANHNITYVRLS